MTREHDRRLMAAAIHLARRAVGRAWPNPAVGCLLARDGRVIARGCTGGGGRPHAEIQALSAAGDRARGATAYVSLEPCAHHGKTGPCVDALLDAGIGRCFIAVQDPDPRVAGKGIARLREAGLDVTVGLHDAQAVRVNAGFFMRMDQGRPLVTVKLASTLDGGVATSTGESQWITGETARQRGHLLRARHDAIMVGAGTAIRDRPRLTCRLPGLGDRSPVRIVVDSRLQLPLTSRLVATARDVPTWLVTLKEGDDTRRDAFEEAGCSIIEVDPDADGRASMTDALLALGRKGINRLLVEGGPQLVASLMRARLVDRLAWFRAPRLMGADGVSAIGGLGIEALSDTPAFVREDVVAAGDDILETYAAVA